MLILNIPFLTFLFSNAADEALQLFDTVDVLFDGTSEDHEKAFNLLSQAEKEV